MAGSVVEDGFTRPRHFRNGSAIADGGLEDDGPGDRSEENRRRVLGLTTENRILTGVDEHGHAGLGQLLPREDAHEPRRRREVERRRTERDQDGVGPMQHRPRELSGVVLFGEPRRAVDQHEIFLGHRQRRETPLELSSWGDFKR